MSRFLPPSFDRQQPFALIAGQRQYPIHLCQQLRNRSIPVRLVAFEGETDEALYQSFDASHRVMIKVGQVGHMLKALVRMECRYAIMAGQITPRKLFKGLHPDFKALQILASLKMRNAETLFGALAREIESVGVSLLDARCFMDDQLAVNGLMSGKWNTPAEAIEYGRSVALEMARLDVGQGVVTARGTVIAVEGFEGTDAMIERAGSFGAKEAVFFKTAKNRQDYRFDVPVLGLRTLEVLKQAAIKTVVLDAGNVLILDRQKVLEEARKLRITVAGIEFSKPFQGV